MAYLEVPKKAGKSELAAGLALLVLLTTRTRGCQVYGAASATRQAMNVYRAACKMVEQSTVLKTKLRVLRGTNRILKRSDPDSFYAAVAADGDFGDGVNPACVIADEIHRWKTRKQLDNWDVRPAASGCIPTAIRIRQPQLGLASMVADGGRWEDFRLKWSPVVRLRIRGIAEIRT